MITLTRLLPEGSKPAPVLLARMKKIAMTSVQRMLIPESFESEGETYVMKAAEGLRPLEVEDIFMDDKGVLYAVSAAPEAVYHVTGDIELMRQACAALMMRGFRVMETEGGFGVCADPELGEALKQIGLDFTEVTEPFTPVPMPKRRCGCGCGHHHHEEEESCGCGCGHHHHEEEESCGCGCGHHHHEEEESCGCGYGHHHHEEEESCGCGCGHRHHKEEESCGCGHHH